ncbi:MAG: hypothetical protein R3324_00745, partial [Halobacteriales archaeon]|nr:hypothetical protein [Halobacteriales archaeon]
MDDIRAPLTFRSSSISMLLVGFVALLGFVVLVGYVPTLFPVPPDVTSAATALGYNPSVAFFLAAGWSLVTGVVAYALAGAGHDRQRFETGPRAGSVEIGLGTVRPRAVILVAAVVALLYCPPFLARYGPYIEDNILLTVQHRMLGGQRPFVDFEFLYGPLMAYSAHGWTKLFGFSLTSFYGYLATLEVLLFSSLTVLVHLFVRDRAMRWFSLAALGILVFNTLMGPNWSGSRKLLGVAAVVVLCVRPLDIRYAIAAGVLTGLQLAYSHDFGVAALASVTAVYGFLGMHGRDVTAVRRAALTLAVGVGTWFACSSVLAGPGFESYIAEVLYLGRRFSSGEAGFRFRWTVNSLAIFALIGLACAVVGRGLRIGKGRPTARDCLLVGGLAFALVMLKSGLNRSDMWHLDAGILLLVLAFLPRDGRRVFRLDGGVKTVATIIVGAVVTTYAFGLLPTGSFYASGWMGGLGDVVTGVPNTSPASAADRIGAEALLVEPERSHPDTDLLDLSRYLAAPQRRDRPVFFYASTYALGIRI